MPKLTAKIAKVVSIVFLVGFMIGNDCDVPGTSCLHCGGTGQETKYNDCPYCTRGLISGTNPVGKEVFYFCTACDGTGGYWTITDCPYCVDGVVQ